MGGVAGHMAHLQEDLSLTFNALIKILSEVAEGEITPVEKVDGQNLFLTIDALDTLKAARNKSDIKKGGMSPKEYASKWKDHPAENAFMQGFKAIQMALDKLSSQEIEEIFEHGTRYINLEIMYPKNPNIILYGAAYVVLHNMKTYDEKGNIVEDPKDAAAFSHLANVLDGTEKMVNDELWRIYGPKIVQLSRIINNEAYDTVVDKIMKLASPVGIDATLGELSEFRLRNHLKTTDLPQNVINDIIARVYEKENAKSVREIKLELASKDKRKGMTSDQKVHLKNQEKLISSLTTTTNIRKVIANTLNDIERIISDFAIEVLRGLQSFFVLDHDKAIKAMRDELEWSIDYLSDLAASGDTQAGKLIDKQLAKLGDIENVASSLEGIVFERNGQLYKMTGTFAMTNQLIGRARRAKPKNENYAIDENKIRSLIRECLSGVIRI
jgi:hypothetical protein